MVQAIIEQKKMEQRIQALDQLAQSKIAPRAAQYDQSTVFPRENFDDLFEGGFLGPTIGKAYGGMGLGHHNGDIHSLWRMTKAIARADMATARCWEGHANALLLINNIATEEQKKRWFEGVLQRGELWSAWSGEPLYRAPHEKAKYGTRMQKVEGGYLLTGSKVFCTGAPGVSKAILLVNPEGSGGARHAGKAGNTVMMMACDMRDDSISLDDAWWDPIGMRASVSFKVNFDQTFLSEKDVLGYPGQYLEEEWQTRFSPHYGATYMGGAEAAYELALNYIRKQNKQADPYIQHRVAKMHLNIETGKMWLQKVASLWESGQIDAAKNAGNSARYLLEQLATETVDHAVHACGARSMIRPSALERIYRDLSFYARHDNDDQVLAIVGKTVLGIDHDKSFFNPDQKQK